MSLLNPVIHFFQAGGIFMYPIALLLLLGVAIALDCSSSVRQRSTSASMPATHSAANWLHPVASTDSVAQFASAAQRIHQPVVVGRRRARPFAAAHPRAELLAPAVGPEFLAGGDVVGRDDFVVPALLDRERAAIGDRKRRAPAADRLAR